MVKGGAFGKAEAGAGLWFKLKNIFTISTVTLFLGILLAQAVIISIQAKSPEPGLKLIGKRFASATLDLDTQSLKIVQQRGVYDSADGSVKGVWHLLVAYFNLASAVFIIFVWLKLFAWLLERT